MHTTCPTTRAWPTWPPGFGLCEGRGQESDIFVNQRNAANALNGDRVEVVAIHRGRDGNSRRNHAHRRAQPQPYVGVAEVARTRSSCGPTRAACRWTSTSRKAIPRREGRRKGRGPHRRLGRRQQKSRGRTDRTARNGGQQRHGDARHSGRIRAALPLRPRNRAGSGGHRRQHHRQGDRRTPRLQAGDDLHGGPADAKDFDDALSVRRVRTASGRSACISPT